jgi:prepilin-type N-terminal cleavage/methylation domain-containing protein
MKKSNCKTGMTMVEVLISVALAAVATSIIYYGIFYSYKTVMRSRARLDAQGIAFDKTWEIYNQSLDVIIEMAMPSYDEPTSSPTPDSSVFSTNGTLQWAVMAETNPPVLRVDYWEIQVQVWAPSNSPLFSVVSTNGIVTAAYGRPLAEYRIWRYRGDR